MRINESVKEFYQEKETVENPDNETSEANADEPKKKRGRKPGSKNKSSVTVEIDARIVSGFCNLLFSQVVSLAGPQWQPNSDEIDAIAQNLKLVLEKRLPSAAIENLPEIALGVVVLSYVSRCKFQSRLYERPDRSGFREAGIGQERIPEIKDI